MDNNIDLFNSIEDLDLVVRDMISEGPAPSNINYELLGVLGFEFNWSEDWDEDWDEDWEDIDYLEENKTFDSEDNIEDGNGIESKK